MTNPTDKLAELRRLNEARTEGPWSSNEPAETLMYWNKEDAAFIAALANNADWLLSCVETLAWYAELKMVGRVSYDGIGLCIGEVWQDIGERARQALGEGE